MPVLFVKELFPKGIRAVLPFFMQGIFPSESNIDSTIQYLSRLLRTGSIIAYPTETFYGLGVAYDNEDSLERLYQLKKRPQGKAMPLIIGNAEQLSLLTPVIPETAERLMQRFWPGPLTLIFKAFSSLSLHITAGTGKVAVRIPGRSFAFDLVRQLDFPVTATSANISGMPPAITSAEVLAYFGSAVSAIVDCGSTPGNAPSTIVDVTGPELKLTRQGMISFEQILAAVQL